MTLEDFFTLTEMKNGLTTPARVEELICVMQKQKARATSNVADAARKRFIVASTLACTENKECLNHFVFLNGLWFLNHWLQEAVKCDEEVTDTEELINALLGSLEKLPVDRENLSASGILVTVEKIFGHKIVEIKERAQKLSERWNEEKIIDYVGHDRKKGCPYVNEMKPSSDAAIVEDKHAVLEGSYRIENDNLQARNLSNLNSDIRDDNLKSLTFNKTELINTMNENEENCVLPSAPSLASKAQDPVEKSCVSPVGLMSAATTPEAIGKGNDQCNTFIRNDDDGQAVVETTDDVSCNTGKSASTSILSSSIASSPSKKSIGLLNASCNLEAKEHNVDIGTTKVHKTLEFNSCEHLTKGLQDLSNNRSLLSKKDAESSSEITKLLNEPTVQACKEADKLKFCNASNSLDFNVNGENKSSDLELESGEIDALEVARQVAIQVEREVVDYREQSCSSSTEASSQEIVKGSLNSKDDSDADSSPENVVVADPLTERQILESPNKTTVQEYSSKPKKSTCDFDLNVDVCFDDHNFAENSILINQVNFSAPTAVSALKDAPGLPITLPHLNVNVELGWRGSAATSAFCLASARRDIDSGETNSSSKHKEKYIEIDLNVAEIENDVAFDPASAKEVPISSEIPSCDSSIEVTSERAERINFDLNCVGEVEAPSCHSSLLKNHHQKEFLSLFPSSLKQPSIKNFDLNDNPCSYDAIDPQSLNIFNHASAHTVKVNDPNITIIVSKMAVERRDHINQSHQSFMGNGLHWNVAMAAKPVMPYVHQVPPPSYGYNGLFTGSVTPFQPAVYGGGNIPHMVDSRGETVVPQMLGSVGVNGIPLLTQPFMMSITSTPSSSTGAGSSHAGYNKLEGNTEAAAQQATSGNSLKRKEPESCWGPFNNGYKQMIEPHKRYRMGQFTNLE